MTRTIPRSATPSLARVGRWALGAILVGAALPSLAPALAGDAPPAPPRAAPGSAADLLARIAPAVVNVRYVLRAGERERPGTTVATAVDPSGLLLADNTAFGEGRTRAVDLKVTVAGESAEHDAVVVVRDSVLNVAWLQIVRREGSLPAVDLGTGEDPVLGQDLRSVTREARGFDHAATVARHYVASRVEKPRLMWAVGGDALGAGRPVFDGKGALVGVSAAQSGVASGDDDDGGGGHFVLPLALVRRSLESARKRVPEAIERAAAKPEDETGSGEAQKPDADPTPEQPK